MSYTCKYFKSSPIIFNKSQGPSAWPRKYSKKKENWQFSRHAPINFRASRQIKASDSLPAMSTISNNVGIIRGLRRPAHQTSVPCAAKVCKEPIVETLNSCGVRSQLAKCCVSVKSGAAPQREDQPFMRIAARNSTRILGLRTKQTSVPAKPMVTSYSSITN